MGGKPREGFTKCRVGKFCDGGPEYGRAGGVLLPSTLIPPGPPFLSRSPILSHLHFSFPILAQHRNGDVLVLLK